MRYKFFQYPRGVNKGGVLNTEICPTISTSSWENNCFLIEIYEDTETKDNLIAEIMEESILIPEATAKGYAEATEGDSVNLEQPNSKTRRGRVGKQMANTLTTSCNQGVVVSEPKAVSYTRDSKGKTQNKHLNEIVNTIHSSTGSGGNTDCFVAEPIPLNPYKDGTCRTIKAQYQQSSRANFTRQDGLGATGVVQIGGGHNEPKVVEDWQTVVGNKQLNPFRGSVEDTSPCITSACGAGGGMTPMLTDADLETTKTKEFIEQVRGHQAMRYRIRKLTPRECFRLMDVDDHIIDKIQAAGISNSQQYKMAGNSIVVACLEKIFEQMFFPQYTNSRTLFG